MQYISAPVIGAIVVGLIWIFVAPHLNDDTCASIVTSSLWTKGILWFLFRCP